MRGLGDNPSLKKKKKDSEESEEVNGRGGGLWAKADIITGYDRF